MTAPLMALRQEEQISGLVFLCLEDEKPGAPTNSPSHEEAGAWRKAGPYTMLFNRPGVAGAVLQTPLSFIH